MRLQLLSDLHLETESFDPEPAPGAEMLVLAGDVDSSWVAFDRFAGWPVPVVYVAGNHEFDRRELTVAWPELRARCDRFGIRMLERESMVALDDRGRRIRFVGTVRWCDFDLLGPNMRPKALRAAGYFQNIMRATRHGVPLDATGIREEALECREWLANELVSPDGLWDATVVITHYGPSLLSVDPRYGSQPTTAAFLNADDDLLPKANLWIHGHVHCRHDYTVEHEGGRTRVVCNARGHTRRGEAAGYDGQRVVEV